MALNIKDEGADRLARHLAAEAGESTRLRVPDQRSADEILGYGADGLPS